MTMYDQSHVRCPVCGKLVPYDRCGDEPQEFICCEKCREELFRVMGVESRDSMMRKRAADPNVCVTCGAILTNRKRADALYCSDRCGKRARKLGVRAADLVKVRRAAITNATGKEKWGSEEERR
jgi:predicted nucleic acid-binding Zn ribbon protein